MRPLALTVSWLPIAIPLVACAPAATPGAPIGRTTSLSPPPPDQTTGDPFGRAGHASRQTTPSEHIGTLWGGGASGDEADATSEVRADGGYEDDVIRQNPRRLHDGGEAVEDHSGAPFDETPDEAGADEGGATTPELDSYDSEVDQGGDDIAEE